MTGPRARQLGVPFEGTPGPLNAITDVAGVSVGHVTLISGSGRLKVGEGPIRTGITAVRPRGRDSEPVFGAWFTLNGCGEMSGTTWLDESGMLYGPVLLTNTLGVSVARDAATVWGHDKIDAWYSLPVVAETWDGSLNDIRGFHVKQAHVWAALDAAASGPVAEGNVGGGTGMTCHDFKGGIGTASRRLTEQQGRYTLGVLVQANHGERSTLRIAGVPVGQEIVDFQPELHAAGADGKSSSIIVVVATDCPLLPHQLKRLAKRVPLGIGRVGGMGDNYSGDIFVAYSTAPLGPPRANRVRAVDMFPNEEMDPLFEATVFATEEAIVNALVAAETMTGIDSNTFHGLPHDRLQATLAKYQRLALVSGA